MDKDDEIPPKLPPRPTSMIDYRCRAIVILSTRMSKTAQQTPPPPLPPRDTMLHFSITEAAESLDCWIDCTRDQANDLLQNGNYSSGTYLLRPCHSRPERYAISIVRDANDSNGKRASIFNLLSRISLGRQSCKEQTASSVKHYLVKESSDGYYLYSSRRFKQVVDLIAYYATTPIKRRSQALLRRSYSAATADSYEAWPEFAIDSQGRRVRLVRKINEGKYETFMAEVNGSRVVSTILHDSTGITKESKASSKIAMKKAAAPEEDKENDSLLEYKMKTAAGGTPVLPIENGKQSPTVYNHASTNRANRSRARSLIGTGALVLNAAIGRAAVRLNRAKEV